MAIGAKLMANMISTAGADRVLGIDFHQHQLQGFFDIPVDHLYAAPVFVSALSQEEAERTWSSSRPTSGRPRWRGDSRSGSTARSRSSTSAARRPTWPRCVNVVGEVEGRDCLIPDDMIDTAGTMTEAARALKGLGARTSTVCATHALLSGPAVERLIARADQGSGGDRYDRDSAGAAFDRLKCCRSASCWRRRSDTPTASSR